MFPLDGDESLRTEKQVVDLAAIVAVAAQQGPVVTEDAAKSGRDQLLACYPGRQDLLLVGYAVGRPGRARSLALLAADRKGAS